MVIFYSEKFGKKLPSSKNNGIKKVSHLRGLVSTTKKGIGELAVETLGADGEDLSEKNSRSEQNENRDGLECFGIILEIVQLVLTVVILKVLPCQQVSILKKIVMEISHG